jgi:hypothetical protein
MLLSFSWLRERYPDILARRAGTVFRAIRAARIMEERERRGLPFRVDMIETVLSVSDLVPSPRPPGRATMMGLLAVSERYLVALVPDERLQQVKLLGREGTCWA